MGSLNKPLALITRPRGEAAVTSLQLESMGIDSFIEPLLTISYKDVLSKLRQALAGDIQGVIVTSRNGVKALKAMAVLPNEFPLITVGDKTANCAMECGFADVKSAGGDVRALGDFIINNYHAKDGGFVYISGEVVAGRLQQRLQKAGFDCERMVAYAAQTADSLSPDCLKLLKERGFDMVLSYSPRTSKTLGSLLKQYGFADKMDKTTLLCISENAVEPLRAVNFAKIMVAEKPNGESVLELIGKL
jgi:uroporphyrinogen-III synthase